MNWSKLKPEYIQVPIAISVAIWAHFADMPFLTLVFTLVTVVIGLGLLAELRQFEYKAEADAILIALTVSFVGAHTAESNLVYFIGIIGLMARYVYYIVDIAFKPSTTIVTFMALFSIATQLFGIVEIPAFLNFEGRVVPWAGFLVLCLPLIFLIVASNRLVKHVRFLREQEHVLKHRFNQVSDLSLVISHNLRTPMATLAGNIELLKYKHPDSPQIDKIEQSLDEVLEQIDTVLKAKKCFTMNNSLDAFIENWKDLFNFDAVESEFELATPYELSEETAIAIFVALTLYTQNSYEYGASNVKVMAKHDGSQLILTHQDNGQGMSRKMLEAYGKPHTTSKSRGSGLGTYLASRILESVGMGWQVESQVDVGTRIILTL